MAERKIGAIFQFGVDQASQKQAEAAITGLKNFAEKALGAIGIAFSVSGANKIIEQYSQINDRIAYAVRGLMDAAEAQKIVSDAARDSRTSYAEMADQAARLTNGNSKLFNIESASKFAKLLNQIGQSAGMDDSKVQNMNSYMAQIMSLGTMNQDTFKQLQTQAPEVLKVIADGLGTNVEQLSDMAKQGTLTAEKIKNAVFLQEGAISAAYAKTSGNVSEGIQTIRNAWGKALASADEQLGITAKIYEWCVKIADKIEPFFNRIIPKVQNFVQKLGGIENVMKLVGAFAAAGSLNTILDVVKKIGAATGILSAKTFALVGLLLMVEDFMAFMRNDGTETIIGGILGDNADEARDKIQGILDKFDTLKEWFSKNVDPEDVFIVAVFIAIAKAIGDIAAHSGTISALKGLLGFGSAGGAALGAGASGAAGAVAGASAIPVLGEVVLAVLGLTAAIVALCAIYEKATGQSALEPYSGYYHDYYGRDAVSDAWSHNVSRSNASVSTGNAKAAIAASGLQVSYDDKGLPFFGGIDELNDMNSALSSINGGISEILPKLERPNNHTLNFSQTNNFSNVDSSTGFGVAQRAFSEIERMNAVMVGG